MSVTIGRASLNDLYGLQVRGRRVSFTTDIEGTDQYGMQALRQQLAGLVDNRDEEVVPFTWSEDATLDGFYRVVSVDIPSTEVQLTNGWIPGVQVELEQVPGFSNPWFETISRGTLRTNSHSVTSALGIYAVGSLAGNASFDWGEFAGLGATWVTTSDGTAQVAAYQQAGQSGSFRFGGAPSSFYGGSCSIEVKYGSSWYPVVGRNIPTRNVWRITNGYIRLTSADAATSGKFEIYAGGSWVSRNMKHYLSRLATHPGIGMGDGSTQPYVSILRNAPDAVVVRVVGASDTAKANHVAIDYAVNRGARHVAVSWTASDAIQLGVAMSSSTAMTSAAAAGAGPAQGPVGYESSAVSGTVACFASAKSFSINTTDGILSVSAAATSGNHMIGAYAGAVGATAARTLADEFYCAVSTASRVVVQ